MRTTILRRSARLSVGVIAAGMLVGLAAPAVAETPAPRAVAAVQPAGDMNAGSPTGATRTLAALDRNDKKKERRAESRRDRVALQLINDQRIKAGCAPLRKVEKLENAAIGQSAVQARRDRMGHDGATSDSTIASRLSGLGYSRYAENVARYGSAQAAVDGWMKSSGHRAAILNCAYTETGLDSERNMTSGQIYWTQTFGG